MPFQRCWLHNGVVDRYFFKAGPNLLEQLVVLRLVSVPDGGNRRQTFRELGLLPEKVH